VNVAPDIRADSKLEADELWFKDAIIYQLHIKAFADSNHDGIDDFAGLTEKLDYLQELGVTALWLLPFYPSPGRDDGYDISDYRHINPDFGTLQDFRRKLIAELRILRDRLQKEAARVQREIVGYAGLIQNARRSTRTISGSLGFWRNDRDDTPRISA
jgi:hypothetical protein